VKGNWVVNPGGAGPGPKTISHEKNNHNFLEGEISEGPSLGEGTGGSILRKLDKRRKRLRRSGDRLACRITKMQGGKRVATEHERKNWTKWRIIQANFIRVPYLQSLLKLSRLRPLFLRPPLPHTLPHKRSETYRIILKRGSDLGSSLPRVRKLD